MQQLLNNISSGFHTWTFLGWRQHILALTPPTRWEFAGLYAALTILFLLGAIVVQFLPLYRPYKDRWSVFLWANFFIGLVLFFFRYESIPYLGADLLRVIHEVSIVVWLNSIIWYRRTGYQQEQLTHAIVSRREKYLPKPKNRPHM